MNKNDIQDLVMGVAVVALGYVLYTQLKNGKVRSGQSPILGGKIGPTYDPMQGAPYDKNTAMGSFGMAGLLSGTTNEWTYGGTDYLASLTNTTIAGSGGKDSIYVKGWWN